MNILGISFEQHDAGAAMVVDGKIIASVNEERFTRFKMDNAAPIESIKYCLVASNLKPSDIDIIVMSGFKFWKKIWFFGNYYRKEALFTRFRGISFFMRLKNGEFNYFSGFKAIIVNLLAMTGIPSLVVLYLVRYLKIKKTLFGFKGKWLWVDHHVGHMASNYYTSGFKNCLSIVIEGTDWINTMVVDRIEEGKITNICASPWPHSAGYFYGLITMLLGFNPYSHAGKITGLSSFGDPNTAMCEVKKLMWVEGMELRLSPNVFTFRNYYVKHKKLPPELETYTKEELSAAFQANLENCILEIVKQAVEITKMENITLSGGVSANVKLNQKIHNLPNVKNIYIFPAMSDAGQAVGVALYVAAQFDDIKEPIQLNNVYLGPHYSDVEIEKYLKQMNVKYIKMNSVAKNIARLLANGAVVARFTGRIEYGPRALGNRSIFYQTSDPGVNDWLNKRLKRTEFMPFAPMSLAEETDKLYLNTKGAEYAARFMTITFSCTNWMKKNCPAVVHVDGTARPQFVDNKYNPDSYEILKEYYMLTGIPAIINTSFNMHGEPIVLTPQNAINSFLHGSLDYLAIGPFLVKHPNN